MTNPLNWNEILKRLFFLYDVGTQDDLGKKLDVSQDLISKWKRGITRPTWDLIERVVQDKEVAWDWLLTGNDDSAKSPCGDSAKSLDSYAEESLDAIFTLQGSLAKVVDSLSVVGKHVAGGGALHEYGDLPGLIRAIRVASSLGQGLADSLEVRSSRKSNHSSTA